jgi:hypothetical protein
MYFHYSIHEFTYVMKDKKIHALFYFCCLVTISLIFFLQLFIFDNSIFLSCAFICFFNQSLFLPYFLLILSLSSTHCTFFISLVAQTMFSTLMFQETFFSHVSKNFNVSLFFYSLSLKWFQHVGDLVFSCASVLVHDEDLGNKNISCVWTLLFHLWILVFFYLRISLLSTCKFFIHKKTIHVLVFFEKVVSILMCKCLSPEWNYMNFIV